MPEKQGYQPSEEILSADAAEFSASKKSAETNGIYFAGGVGADAKLEDFKNAWPNGTQRRTSFCRNAVKI